MNDKLENGLIILNSFIGLNNIETILGVSLLTFQLLLLLIKIITKIYIKIKNKDYQGIIEDVENDIKDIENKYEDIKDKINE